MTLLGACYFMHLNPQKYQDWIKIKLTNKHVKTVKAFIAYSGMKEESLNLLLITQEEKES